MTREEAIKYIKANCYGEWCEDDWRNAMDMAIEALSKMDFKENYWKGCETCKRAMANVECELWGDRMTEECGGWKEIDDEQIH